MFTDSHILVVAELDEVAFGLPHLVHQFRYLHLLSITDLYVAGDVEPACHGVHGEMHGVGYEFTASYREACAFRPLHDAIVGMLAQRVEKAETLLDRQCPVVTVLLVLKGLKQLRGLLEVLALGLHVAMCLETLALIGGGDHLHAFHRPHIGWTLCKRPDEQLQVDLVLTGLQAEDNAAVGLHRLDVGVLQQIAHDHHIVREGFEHLREFVLSLGREGADGIEQFQVLLLLPRDLHNLEQLGCLLADSIAGAVHILQENVALDGISPLVACHRQLKLFLDDVNTARRVFIVKDERMPGKRVDDGSPFEFIRCIAIPARVIFHHQRGHGTVLLRIGQGTAVAESGHRDVAS